MRALRELRRGRPGRRFQDYYRRHRERRRARTWVMAAGWALLVVGLPLVFTPGPGIPLVLIGALVLAAESRTAARALDRAELRLRLLFGVRS